MGPTHPSKLAFAILATLLSACARSTIDSMPPAIHRAPELTPDVRALLDEMVTASGGADRMHRIHSRLLVGSLTVPATGQRGRILIAIREPNEYVAECDLGDFGRTIEGVHGDLAWTLTADGAALKSGGDAAQAKRSGLLHTALNLPHVFESIELDAAPADWRGTKCDLLRLVPPAGPEEHFFVDRTNHRVIGTVVRFRAADHMETILTTQSDFRTVDGLVLPHRIEQLTMSSRQTLVFEFTSIRHNVDSPEFDDVFVLPPEVVVLARRRTR